MLGDQGAHKVHRLSIAVRIRVGVGVGLRAGLREVFPSDPVFMPEWHLSLTLTWTWTQTPAVKLALALHPPLG